GYPARWIALSGRSPALRRGCRLCVTLPAALARGNRAGATGAPASTGTVAAAVGGYRPAGAFRRGPRWRPARPYLLMGMLLPSPLPAGSARATRRGAAGRLPAGHGLSVPAPSIPGHAGVRSGPPGGHGGRAPGGRSSDGGAPGGGRCAGGAPGGGRCAGGDLGRSAGPVPGGPARAWLAGTGAVPGMHGPRAPGLRALLPV